MPSAETEREKTAPPLRFRRSYLSPSSSLPSKPVSFSLTHSLHTRGIIVYLFFPTFFPGSPGRERPVTDVVASAAAATGGGCGPVRSVRITFVTIARLNNLETCIRGVAGREKAGGGRGRESEREKEEEKEKECERERERTRLSSRSRMALRSALVVN